MRLITLASAFALASLPALGQDLDFSIDDIPFGADSGDWTNDGECDDPRFWGPGMATVLLSDDLGADATDCRTLMEAGAISFDRDPQPGDVIVDGIIFGDDSSEWSNDGECDDMRFEGPGMTLTPLLQEDMRTDATDCATAWENGQLWLWGTGD